jgi:hypothetical protein
LPDLELLHIEALLVEPQRVSHRLSVNILVGRAIAVFALATRIVLAPPADRPLMKQLPRLVVQA